MKKKNGELRQMQVQLNKAESSAEMIQLLEQRREDVFESLSFGYLSSRVYVMRIFILFAMEVSSSP
eukprot:SAG11_NODE_281_length_11257_cov_45.949633_2_plen_66_part_00